MPVLASETLINGAKTQFFVKSPTTLFSTDPTLLFLQYIDFGKLLWKGILTKRSRKNAQKDKKMAGRERGGEKCPGIMRQSFIFARPITFGFAYMNPTRLVDFFVICFNSTTVYPKDVRETFSECCNLSLPEKRKQTTTVVGSSWELLSYVVYSRFTPASYFHQSNGCGYSKHTQSVAPGAIINGRLNFENTADRT